ncbi:MAG: WhiB family transcriptional regulator [Rhodococcus sp. (in: high G+C Gram-positive bacteria)]|uniref:WhiB family transcriptional regulator n=1 Tax=Rhodococcus sp. TaxID=1831 RepID=UPI002ADBF8D6|nr:WhiB family transcriptional regulator [Rhodococcus sp. (in: high G+C Gram-positive bacteria)]
MGIAQPAPALPYPATSNWEWQLEAQCQSMPVSMFYPPQGLRGYTRTSSISDAKKICAQCPVVSDCRSHALEANEPYGIWGGLTAYERYEKSTSPARSR